MLAYYRTWLAIRELDIPTIAAVNGPAIGAGAALALACDIRWAGSSALLSLPFLRMGMHPGMLSTYLAAEVGGVAVARDLLLTGRRVAAEELRALGLVSRVIPDAELLAEALAGAEAVAAGAPVAVRLTKVALRDGRTRDWATATQWEGLAQAVTLASRGSGRGPGSPAGEARSRVSRALTLPRPADRAAPDAGSRQRVSVCRRRVSSIHTGEACRCRSDRG